MTKKPTQTPGIDVLTNDQAITLAWAVRQQTITGESPHPITIERLCWFIIATTP